MWLNKISVFMVLCIEGNKITLCMSPGKTLKHYRVFILLSSCLHIINSQLRRHLWVQYQCNVTTEPSIFFILLSKSVLICNIQICQTWWYTLHFETDQVIFLIIVTLNILYISVKLMLPINKSHKEWVVKRA